MDRIYHPWNKWECYKAGFFTKANITNAEDLCVKLYSDSFKFENACERLIKEWKYSCEHNLTNDSLNRVAWVGQACCALIYEVCSDISRGAFNLVDPRAQEIANEIASRYIRIWEDNYERQKALSETRRVGRSEREDQASI